MKITGFFLIVVLLATKAVCAGEADVVDVSVQRTGENVFSFSVTVRHQDEGWDHYANKWDVVAPDGTVLGTRTLLHPHETEQPFTRSQSGINIPPSITQVRVRAHDIVDGFGGQEILIDLEKDSGPGFEVER